MVMFIGGCGGSTTCGIKVFRLQVLAATVRVQINRLLRPHAVVLAYYNRRLVAPEVMDSVMGFFYLYILGFVSDRYSAWHDWTGFYDGSLGAATSISNVGPGLGEVIGAEGNFSSLPDSAKMGNVFWHVAWEIGNFHCSGDVESRLLATLRLSPDIKRKVST